MKTFKILIRSAIVVTMLLLLVSFLTGPVETLTAASPFEAPAVEVAADADAVHKLSLIHI